MYRKLLFRNFNFAMYNFKSWKKGGGLIKRTFSTEKKTSENTRRLCLFLSCFQMFGSSTFSIGFNLFYKLLHRAKKKKSTRAFIYRRQVSTQSNDIHGTVGPFRSGLACAGGGGCKRAVGAQPEIGAFGEGNCTFCEKELLGRWRLQKGERMFFIHERWRRTRREVLQIQLVHKVLYATEWEEALLRNSTALP